ncbi:hypothetical protein B0T20DRAFT_243934 [Sordaria brevicollis]|uniref:Uncharacterized protein n=1 Tax=Sordaria brevicollis TaxID=83679 RepID=A0AAE0PBH8_SORBR|nr:hypothetical protein B0T20DRAFT_243934 [Sordaria brevicollis]
MLTSIFFRRAAYVDILTAQTLKQGRESGFSHISKIGPLLQSKGQFATITSIRKQETSRTSTVPLSPNIFARPFHVSAVRRPNCDIGLPYNRPACEVDIENDEHNNITFNPICDRCKVNPTAHEYVYENYKTGSPEHVSYCKECHNEILEHKRKREEHDKKARAAHREKVNKMMEHVRSLSPGLQQVPIAYAIDKVSIIWPDLPAAKRHKALRNFLSEELNIVKVGNRWKCDKGRVDAMDFEMWRSIYHPRPVVTWV